MRSIGLGILLASLVLGTTVIAQATLAQQDAPPNLGADYIGSARCASCHNSEEAPLWDTWNHTLHAQTIRPASRDTVLGDLSATDTLTIPWPNGQARPVARSDITYVIGGRYTQKYLAVMEPENGETGYYVLPIVWNLPPAEGQEGTWTVTYTEDWFAPENDWRVTCAGCHTTGWTEDAVESGAEFALAGEYGEGNVEIGIGCERCHGPGGDHQGGLNAMPRLPDAQVCAQCHTQGRDPSGQYPWPLDYQPGLPFDPSVFVMAGADDETLWWPTGHARATNAQYNEWQGSAHATALDTLQQSALAEDSCLRCHTVPPDSTDPTPDAAPWTLATAEYGVTCATCHAPHPAESAPLPPQSLTGEGGDKLPVPSSSELFDAEGDKLNWAFFPSIWQIEPGTVPDYLLRADEYTLCTSCHNSQTPEGETLLIDGVRHHPVQEMFEGWQVVENIEGVPAGHFRAADGPRCVDCHMPETAMISETEGARSHTLQPALPAEPGQPNSCTTCHTDLSPRYLQRFVDEIQTETTNRLHDINDTLTQQTEVEEWITTVIQFIVSDGSRGVHNYAYADALLHEVELELGLVSAITDGNGSAPYNYIPVKDPATCEECHREEMLAWQGSPHALASLNEPFLQEYADQGGPNYCKNCHASGYNPATGTAAFEGVVCSRCHMTTGTTEHPPAPVEIGDASIICGQCHSGAHAPTYDEWLASDHRVAGVDCVDCHTPHDNGLILGDVNTTCGDCHREALVDEIHMGEDMSCVDCHLTRRHISGSEHVLATGHDMAIDPGVCAECHGNTHLLSVREYRRSPEEVAEVEELQSEINRLQEQADENRFTSVVGGALGMAIIGVMLFLVLRLRRFL